MKALIIDDEPDNVQLQTLQLARHCPQVEIIGQFTDSPSVLLALRTLRPSLVFLDIEMPMLNGFQLLEQLGEVPHTGCVCDRLQPVCGAGLSVFGPRLPAQAS